MCVYALCKCLLLSFRKCTDSPLLNFHIQFAHAWCIHEWFFQKLYVCNCVCLEFLSICFVLYTRKVLNARLHCSWWCSCMPITNTSNTKCSTCKGRLSDLYSTKHSFYTAANTPCVSAQTCKNSHKSAIQTSTHPLFTTHPNPAPWLDKPPMHCIVTDFQTAYFQTAAVPKKSGVHGFIGNSLSRPEMCYLLDALFRNDLPQLPCPQSPKSALLPFSHQRFAHQVKLWWKLRGP